MGKTEASVICFICFRLSALFASGFLAPAFLLHLFLLLDSEEFAPAVEILFHNQTETLSVEAVSGEIAVVGLIIHAYGEITVREDEITEIEVADKTLCGIRIVAIAKLTIEQQAVIEQLATQDTLILGIIEAFVTRRNICTEIPVVTLYDIGKYSVYLL